MVSGDVHEKPKREGNRSHQVAYDLDYHHERREKDHGTQEMLEVADAVLPNSVVVVMTKIRSEQATVVSNTPSIVEKRNSTPTSS